METLTAILAKLEDITVCDTGMIVAFFGNFDGSIYLGLVLPSLREVWGFVVVVVVEVETSRRFCGDLSSFLIS
jgi:hypothetical protein